MRKRLRKLSSLTIAMIMTIGLLNFVPLGAVNAAMPAATIGQPCDGVDYTSAGLLAAGSRIYYGAYDHSTSMSAHQGTRYPVLWRIMGEELYSGSGDGYITALSEYLVEARSFGSNATWETSTVRTFLNGDFITNCYNASESVSLATPTRMSTINMTGDAMTSNTPCKIYLPGVTRNARWEDVSWYAYITTNTSGTALLPDSSLIATWRSGTPANWTMRSNNGTGYVLMSFGDHLEVDQTTPGTTCGLRPIFKLDPKNVVFASEIIASGTPKNGQTPADPANGYAAGAGSAKNYKLTVLGGNNGADVGTLTGVPTAVQEVAEGAGTISIPGVTPSQTGAGYTINYKVVGTSGGGRVIAGCGATAAQAAATLIIDTDGLLTGEDYDVYVWLQKNNDRSSHEASMPAHFGLTVTESNDPPVLSGVSPTSVSIAVDHITATSSKRGNLYLVPAATAMDVDAFEAVVGGAAPTGVKTPITSSGDPVNVLTAGLPDGAYKLCAVDFGGRISNAVAITVYGNTRPVLTTTGTTVINHHTASITARSSEAGYIYLVPAGAYTDKAALDALSVKAVKTVTAGTDVAFAGSDINMMTDGAYQLYGVNAAGNLSVPVAVTLDTTAPVLAAVTAYRSSASRASVMFTSDSAGSYYYAVVNAGAQAPIIDTAGAGNPVAAGSSVINISSLAIPTAYDVYIVAKDLAGNISAALKIIIPEYQPREEDASVIPLEDWKIAPSGHLTVDTTNYPLTPGLPAEVNRAEDACDPANPLTDWVDAKAPGTVAGALLDAGKYDALFTARSGNPDVYFDANMTKIPFTDFAKPWWWRTSVDIPLSNVGKRVTLTFNSINYVGRIWVNGHEVSNEYTNITDIREVQNRTGAFPYTYSSPTTGTNLDTSSVANYTNATMVNPASLYNFENLKTKFIGAFRTYEIDITDFINSFGSIDGSLDNIILVENARGYYITSGVGGNDSSDFFQYYVDWHPVPPDHNMGLNGRASISFSDDIRLNNPAVASRVAMDYSYADVTFFVEATNLSSVAVTGDLTAVIKDPVGNQVGAPLTVSGVTVPGGKYNQEISVTTRINDPLLWWDYMMGDQPLYTVDYTFSIAGDVSGALNHRFGIREISNEVNNSVGGLMLQVYVNHKPVLLRAAGYCPTDTYLRHREKDDQAVIDYLKYMGLNSVRDEGKFYSEDLLELFDENGILFMTGWCCCDRFQYPNSWVMSERFVVYENLHSLIRQHRSHPSMIMWFNGSDEAPDSSPFSETGTNANRNNVARKYLEIEGRLNWFDIGCVCSSAAASTGGIAGATGGMRMGQSYDTETPTAYYANNRGTYGFIGEGHGGAGIPVIETMKKMIPEANLWPYNTGANYNRWNYHAVRGSFANIDALAMYIDNTYGGSDSLEEWLMRAQVYQYDVQRAQYESLNQHRFVGASGHVNWMTTGTRPGIMWNQFDYYMNPFGSTFGSMKANEPVHISYDYWKKDIYVINNTTADHGTVTASCTVYDINGNVIGRLGEKAVEVPADDVTGATGTATNRTVGYRAEDKSTFHTRYTAITTEYNKQISGTNGVNKIWSAEDFNACLTRPTTDVYFINLVLKDSSGNVVSRNDYAVPRRGDIAGAGGGFARSQAYQNADLTQLNQLPNVNLVLNEVSKTSGDIVRQVFTVKNDSNAVAYAVELKGYKDTGHTELVSPIIYEDNLFTLYPGETRTITVTHRAKYFGGYADVVATCYNNVIKNKPAAGGNLYAAMYSSQVTGVGSSTNLARGRTVTGPTTNPGNATAISAGAVSQANGGFNIVEGDFTSSTSVTGSQSITVDLGSVQSFDRIMVRWNGQPPTGSLPNVLGGRPEQLRVEIAGADSVYSTIIENFDNSKAASVMTNIVFDKLYSARYIRLTPRVARTASAAIDQLSNTYPDLTSGRRNPSSSGVGNVSAVSNFTVNSLEVYRSYSHFIQVDLIGVGNAVSVTANARDGYGKAPQVITADVKDKYSRMRMIPFGDAVEFVIMPAQPGGKVYATLDGADISDRLIANPDGSFSLFSDETDDFAVLSIYDGDPLDLTVTDSEIKLNYWLSGDLLPKIEVNVILAVYDEGGKLIYVWFEPVTISDTLSVGSLVIPMADVPGAYSVKGMLWSADYFIPMCPSADWVYQPVIIYANLALNKTTTASSQESAAEAARYATDGNMLSRWASAEADNQWIMVDLGADMDVSRVVLFWETAYARNYRIETAKAAAPNTFTTAASVTGGGGGMDTLTFPSVNARYIRLFCETRATAWGFSLYEFEIYER